MQFTTTSQKASVLEEITTGMNTEKNRQIFFESRETTRSSKHNKKLIVDEKEIADQTNISECIRELYKSLFKKCKHKIVAEIKSFLSHINIPKLSEDKVKLCEKDLNKRYLYDYMKSSQNDKSPGNDDLTK